MRFEKSAYPLLCLVLAGLATSFLRSQEPEKPPLDGPASVVSPKETLKVAVVSSESRLADVNGNLKRFEKWIDEAASQGAKLICFPELALCGYSLEKDILKVAEPIPGPATSKLEAIAKSRNVYISMGMAEKEGDNYYITQFLVGPKGYVGKYRKYHTTRTERDGGFISGKDFTVWNVEGFRVGPLICYDGGFKDTLEAMKRLEVDVIVHPHANSAKPTWKNAEEWTRLKLVSFVQRAVEARAYILINNNAGDIEGRAEPGRSFASGAMVLDPLGQAIARTTATDRAEKMVIATLVKPLSHHIPGYKLKKRAQDK